MTTDDRLVYWQRRCRDAEQAREYVEEEMESQRRWMSSCFDEERRLRDRCTFLYGEATRLGATPEQLNGNHGPQAKAITPLLTPFPPHDPDYPDVNPATGDERETTTGPATDGPWDGPDDDGPEAA